MPHNAMAHICKWLKGKTMNKETNEASSYILNIENTFSALLETTYQVQSIEYRCQNDHICQLNNSYSLVLLSGTGNYESTQEWALRGQGETRHACTVCNKLVFIQILFYWHAFISCIWIWHLNLETKYCTLTYQLILGIRVRAWDWQVLYIMDNIILQHKLFNLIDKFGFIIGLILEEI